MDHEIEQRVMQVMSDILNIPMDRIDDDTRADRTAGWDSVNHIQLIIALEEEMGVAFDAQEFESLLSYPSIVKAVRDKLAGKSGGSIAPREAR